MCSIHDRLHPLPPVRAARRPAATAVRSSRSRRRSRRRPAVSRWWGRSRGPRRRTGSCAGCGWGRRCRAVRGCGSWRRTRRACARSGARCSTGSRGSAPQVESDHAGAAFFGAEGLHGLHGGDLAGVLAAARRALGPGVRFGAAPSRFASHAAALQARPRRRGRPSGRPAPLGAVLVEADRRSATSSLRFRCPSSAPGPSFRPCPDVLERLGIRTLGEFASLPSRAVAERFGHPGLLALDLSRGRDTPLEPRRPFEPVVERLDLPEAASGQQLERALELLIARVLARRERRGRSLRGLAVSARFVAGGTWRTSVTLRHASADPARIRIAARPAARRAAGAVGVACAGGGGVRPAGAGSGPPAGRGRRCAPDAARRGRSPGAPGGRGGRRAARAGRGSRLAHPRAPHGARAVPGRVVTPDGRRARRLGTPKPTSVIAGGRRGAAQRRRERGGLGPRGMGRGGPLVDGEAASEEVLRGGAARRAERGGVQGSGGRRMVPAAFVGQHRAICGIWALQVSESPPIQNLGAQPPYTGPRQPPADDLPAGEDVRAHGPRSRRRRPPRGSRGRLPHDQRAARLPRGGGERLPPRLRRHAHVRGGGLGGVGQGAGGGELAARDLGAAPRRALRPPRRLLRARAANSTGRRSGSTATSRASRRATTPMPGGQRTRCSCRCATRRGS